MRPFNQREISQHAAACVHIHNKSTTITAKNGEKKTFTFDFSFNSFDSEDSNFADQQMVFDCLGKEYVLEGAWKGYVSGGLLCEWLILFSQALT